MNGLARFKIVLVLAWRNLFSHKGKNTIVGLIMLLGTFLVVLGSSLLDSVDHSMTRSITASVAGHMQIYDEKARDELALFGEGFMGRPDIGTMPEFNKIKTILSKVPNVKAIVPMGIDFAEFFSSTQLDDSIDGLRKAHEAGQNEKAKAQATKIRSLCALLEEEYKNRLKVLADTTELQRQLADIRRAQSDEFWALLPTDPNQVIEFLDTKLAPLVDQNEMNFLRYLGTDLHLFAKHFDTFEIVSGEMVPQGSRGMLISQKFYDDRLRNKVAREFDALHRQVVDLNRKIADDPMLQNRVKRMVRQYRRVTYQFQPEQVDGFKQKLQTLMPESKAEQDIDELVQLFLNVTDSNLEARHKFFFAEIAPHIPLYLFDVGDVITLRAFTRTGYIKSANIKIYGTYRFQGLESSALASAFNLMDIMTFRDLFGYMTREKLEELKEIKQRVGVTDVAADDAEEALFGGDGEVEAAVKDHAGFDEFADVDLKGTVIDGKVMQDSKFTQADIDNGLALNAAIVIEDADKLPQTLAAVEQAIAKNGLGLQVADWKSAAGIVGQLITLMRALLYVAIFIIFLVAIVIINNTMVMATMERTMEIGTMRAIGGQRRFVLVLFMTETTVLGLIAGVLGAALGALTVSHFGTVGIPAVEDILVLLFGGPRLYPTVGLSNLIVAGAIILGVSMLATFYPAFIATRIPPVVAMQPRE